MFKELQAEWESLKERNPTASELAKFYSEAVTTIRDKIIPDFFINESTTIRNLLTEPSTERYQVRSLLLPVSEMTEYQVGVNQYIHEIMEKTEREDIVEDIQKVKENSLSFVDHLFSESANPVQEVMRENVCDCLEAIEDLHMQCTEMLESAKTMSQEMSTCENTEVREDLENMYYNTEINFVMQYMKECFDTFKTYKGETDIPSDKGSVLLI